MTSRGPFAGQVVSDSRGESHLLTKKLNTEESGFGELWLTTNPEIVVKFWKHGSHPPKAPSGIPPDWPAAALHARLVDGQRGLVLQLLPGLAKLSSMSFESNGVGRLQVLRRVAELLALLHAAGLVFGDLHGGNILVSPDGESVMFVDLDTMASEGATYEELPTSSQARIPASEAPWGFGEGPSAADDVFRFLRLIGRCPTGPLGRDSAWRDDLVRESPGLAALIDPLLEPLPPASQAPSTASIWRTMCADEDRRRVCQFCSASYVDSRACPRCLGESEPRQVTVKGVTGRHEFLVDAWNPGVLRRRHVAGGPAASPDARLGEILLFTDRVAVLVADAEEWIGEEVVVLELECGRVEVCCA